MSVSHQPHITYVIKTRQFPDFWFLYFLRYPFWNSLFIDQYIRYFIGWFTNIFASKPEFRVQALATSLPRTTLYYNQPYLAWPYTPDPQTPGFAENGVFVFLQAHNLSTLFQHQPYPTKSSCSQTRIHLLIHTYKSYPAPHMYQTKYLTTNFSTYFNNTLLSCTLYMCAHVRLTFTNVTNIYTSTWSRAHMYTPTPKSTENCTQPSKICIITQRYTYTGNTIWQKSIFLRPYSHTNLYVEHARAESGNTYACWAKKKILI